MKKIVDGILKEGIRQNASHIHIEPDVKSSIKFRVCRELELLEGYRIYSNNDNSRVK